MALECWGFFRSLPLVLAFDPAEDDQFVSSPSIPTPGASHDIGIDGLGLPLVLLTTLLGWMSILSSWNAIRRNTTRCSL